MGSSVVDCRVGRRCGGRSRHRPRALSTQSREVEHSPRLRSTVAGGAGGEAVATIQPDAVALARDRQAPRQELIVLTADQSRVSCWPDRETLGKTQRRPPTILLAELPSKA